MQFLYVTDEALKDKLLNNGCSLLQEINSVNMMWVFEADLNLLSLGLPEYSDKNKCVLQDRLTMFF